MLDPRRREFIALLGGAAAALPLRPLAARAQQPAMPMIGFMNSQSAEEFTEPLRGFRQGLKETGYVEGENVKIQYRWAENRTDVLPELASELVRDRVAVIAATGGHLSALAAKTATKTIPIVFNVGEDPVSLGLVASLARPAGNATGVNFFTGELSAKRLELLRELVPTAVRVAVLVNPTDAAMIASPLREVEAAAPAMGVQIQVLHASTGHEIDAAFATFAEQRPDALLVFRSPFFNTRRVQLTQWAARQAVPAIYQFREFATAGGLMSYGASLREAYRQVGLYTGRILKGARAEDLPVVQPSKFELVINAQTARMLRLTVPPSLLALADEVIE